MLFRSSDTKLVTIANSLGKHINYKLIDTITEIKKETNKKIIQEIKNIENKLEDKRYLNLCVEHWNYTPVPFETIRSIFNEQNK